MTTPAEQINALLPQLTHEQLTRLIARARALLQLSIDGTEEAESGEVMVVDAIARTLTGMGVECPHAGVLMRAIDSRFRQKLPGLLTYLRNAHPQRQGQIVVLRMGVELLYKDMTNAGYPVTARTLMGHIHRLPAAINRAFPGYARGGMMQWIVRIRES